MWLLFKINNLLAQVQGQATPIATPTEVPINIPTPPPILPTSPKQTIFQYILLFFYILICVSLVTLVLIQTSKSEGLSGTLGGTTQSIFRGKRSFEDKLGQITTYIAVAFIISSILIAFFAF